MCLANKFADLMLSFEDSDDMRKDLIQHWTDSGQILTSATIDETTLLLRFKDESILATLNGTGTIIRPEDAVNFALSLVDKADATDLDSLHNEVGKL